MTFQYQQPAFLIDPVTGGIGYLNPITDKEVPLQDPASVAITGGTIAGDVPQFLQAGTGAVARTAQDKQRERVSVSDFMTAAEKADALLSAPALDHTLAWRKAVAACLPGGTVYGDPAHTYSINWQADGYCVLIEKGITVDLNGAAVIYKPWKTGDAAATHSPAFFFRGSVGTAYTVNAVSGRPNSVTLSTVGDAANFAAGDYVFLTSTAVRRPWNYPLGIYAGFTGYGEIQRIETIDPATGIATFSRSLEGDYAATASIAKLALLAQPRLLNVRSAVEVDSNVVSTRPLSANCGHFASFYACLSPKMEEWTVSGFRMFVCMSWLNVAPDVRRVRGYNPPALYPSNGGHAYVIRHNLCLNPYSARNVGVKPRHLIDYTSSHGATQHDNVCFEPISGAYITHGFGERRITSIDDCAYGGTSAGWTFGDPSFRESYEGKIVRPVYIGGGNAIVAQSMSDGLVIERPNIRMVGASSATAIRFVAGAKNCKVRDGVVDMTAHPGTAEGIGCYPSTDTPVSGSMVSISGAAGTDSVVSVSMSSAHSLSVGDAIFMAVRDGSPESQFAGSWTVASVPNATDFTYVRTGVTTEAISGLTGSNRVWRAPSFKPCENISVVGTTVNGAPSGFNTVSLSGRGTLEVRQVRAECGSSANSAFTITSSYSDVPPTHIFFDGNTIVGAHTITLSMNEYASAVLSLVGNASKEYTDSFWQPQGSTFQKNTRYLSAGKSLSVKDNNAAASSPTNGLSCLNLWDAAKAGATISGNTYPANTAVTSTFNKNWEFGTFTPVIVGGTSAGTASYSNQIGKYALQGRTLQVRLRISWSAFTGTGTMKIQGLPYSNGATSVPCSVAEATLAFTGQLAPAWTATEIRLRQMTGGAAADTPVAAGADIVLSASLELPFA